MHGLTKMTAAEAKDLAAMNQTLHTPKAENAAKSWQTGYHLRRRNGLLCLMVAACLAASITGGKAASVAISYSACSATITWSSGVLEQNSALGGGSWTTVIGATSPYVINPCSSGDANFYRLNLGAGSFSHNIVGYVNVAVPHI